MPFYSEELKEEVRSANDIVDVISGYVRLQKKGSSYVGLCPFHNEKTGSFHVSQNKQLYHCFGCGAGGDVFGFLMEYENYTFREAMEQLAGRAGMVLPKQELSEQEKRESDYRARLLEVNREAGKYYYMLLRNARGAHALAYFRDRELSDETMKKFGLGYADKYSDDLYRYLKSKGYDDRLLKDSGLITVDEKHGAHDKFWNRAMFPIMNVHHKIIGFGGRVMGEGEPKYLNSPETQIFDKSRNLYGLNLARQSRREQLLLCEGYMDVIALHQAGFDNAVASLGTAFTSGHASLLKRYAKEVYLTFDSDGAGVKAALRAIPILKEAGITAKVIDMKPYKDPDEFIKALGAEAYQERIGRAENSFMFEIRILEQNYNMGDPQAKTEFYKEAARKLLEFSETLERNNYIEAVAEKYQIGFDNLRRLVEQASTQVGLIKKPEPLKSGVHKKEANKADGVKKAQKLLLTWLSEEPALYPLVREYLTPEDFADELCRHAAAELFAQLEAGELNLAKIPGHFEDPQDQRQIVSAFHETIREVKTPAERGQALKDTVLKLKEHHLLRLREDHDPNGMQERFSKMLEEKKMLEALRRKEFLVTADTQG
ncbi:MAG: DNA primase [Eubacterium sp.]|nr:DNA primase [Eubacterium sp.]